MDTDTVVYRYTHGRLGVVYRYTHGRLDIVYRYTHAGRSESLGVCLYTWTPLSRCHGGQGESLVPPYTRGSVPHIRATNVLWYAYRYAYHLLPLLCVLVRLPRANTGVFGLKVREARFSDWLKHGSRSASLRDVSSRVCSDPRRTLSGAEQRTKCYYACVYRYTTPRSPTWERRRAAR